ncbi:Glycosyltransferase involved in cell wall bisynthesis [Chitinophaga jiangningensis]|uniref:Glycosyltransferase involved in cell wall bisynthesis n=1 Tax=Chitinophaga jiangningensis TaxID=1419482 RepID=A0A1M7MQC3_9BACT|nr:glycosyltransferase [Chitinophaga jiangningensis]SHM93150.1 Glycosyltransferase involved in cell wall bisynthesis [Chitinophaga jiangningensis]
MPVQNRDIVVIGLQPWYTPIGSNCKNIALEFSRHNRVLYINAPLDRKTLLTEKQDANLLHHKSLLKNTQDSLVRINDNMWNYYPLSVMESVNWLPSTTLFRVFNQVNNRRFAKEIRKAMQQLGFRNIILFNDNDMFRGYHLKELLQPELYIYYSRDYLLAVDYWKKHGQTMEPLHIAKADIGVANSMYLAERLKSYNPNSYYIGQGCELSLFDPRQSYTRPADIPPPGKPVIGYVGALTSLRLDISLITEMATRRPDWNFVLVGPEDADFQSSALHQLGNVYFPGRKPMAELPAYVASFDVCMNPQLVNDMTIGNYPLKVDEYLAMGKPVLATATPTMELFRDYVYLAANVEGYIEMAERALAEVPELQAGRRREFALSHTWENSVAGIYDAIAKHEQH